MKILAFANEKGGVAKSTSAINVATGLAQKGLNVLAIDVDPQANTTSVLVGHKTSAPHIYHALKKNRRDLPISEVIYSTREDTPGTLLILPSSPELKGKETELAGLIDSQRLLRNRLQEVAAQYSFDYCVIDSPPGIHFLNLNVLFAADHIVVPIFPNLFSIEGIADLIGDISQVSDSRETPIEVNLLLTIVEEQTVAAREIKAVLEQTYGNRLLKTIIPKNVRVSEANTNQQSVLTYAPQSKGAQSYLQLVEELLEHGR